MFVTPTSSSKVNSLSTFSWKRAQTTDFRPFLASSRTISQARNSLFESPSSNTALHIASVGSIGGEKDAPIARTARIGLLDASSNRMTLFLVDKVTLFVLRT